MSDFNYKLDNFLFPIIKEINNPIILELGVQKGRSTKKFFDICKKNFDFARIRNFYQNSC